MERFVRLLIVVTCMVCMGCGHDSPPVHDDTLAKPGGEGTGSRPGAGDANSMKHELEDAVWRVAGPGISLRYDRGGVLFNTLADGSTEIVDLDGADTVVVTLGKEGDDSLMTGASIVVNGKRMEINRMKVLGHGDGRSWYVATGTSDAVWVVVLP